MTTPEMPDKETESTVYAVIVPNNGPIMLMKNGLLLAAHEDFSIVKRVMALDYQKDHPIVVNNPIEGDGSADSSSLGSLFQV